MTEANLGDSAPQIQRRGFLKSGALTGIAASTAMMALRETTPPVADDRRLIELCAEIEALNRQAVVLAALPFGQPGRFEAIDANDDRWQALTREASAMPARTLAGIRARARAVSPYLDNLAFEGPIERGAGGEDFMLRALACELLGVA